ncbi:MAG: serine/threonine protein kinase [Kofleriaceae bacterium]|nr:serine/threonine protein kinase [Kofleriaceae bacterium]
MRRNPDPLGTDEIRAARPARDALEMDAVRARAEHALFGGAPPARIGRYVLSGASTAGGMGVVYAAHDPDLDRKVALKVVHPRHRIDERARERLLVEARALAKLDHPNVVRIHDVLTYGDQIVIVMEWVDGRTLAATENGPRRWRDVLAVYLQAGRGLAAAHGVGVVHRDFKPSNAILGDDGRVRVLDFGLARRAAEAEVSSVPASGSPTELTGTGDVLGTLAYCAPEQLAAEAATPASDQFSFGVSLHRALEGVPPFRGDNAAELAASMREGTINTAAAARRVPAWLRRAVARMLAVDPLGRFPTMDAALAELSRPRGWVRWRAPVLATSLVGFTAAFATIGLRDTEPEVSCDGGASEVARVWNPDQRHRIARALDAARAPYVHEIRERVLHGLDAYGERWSEAHREACVAHRRGEQSAALLDRRMLCLHQRLTDLRAAVATLEALDGTSMPHAVDVVARMTSVAECADVARLDAETPPPADIAQRVAVAAIQEGLSKAQALDRAGRSAEALTIADDAIERARRSGYPPIAANAALSRGRILISLHDRDAAAEALAEARTIALEHRMFAGAVEAAAREMFAAGTSPNAAVRAALDRQAVVFVPLSKTLDGDHYARPLLLNNVGTLRMAEGDRAEARRFFEEARASLAGVPEVDLELTCIDRNLAMVTSQGSEREALAAGVWERLRTGLGEAHVATLDALDAYARYVRDPDRAERLLGHVCTTYDRLHPELVEDRVYCASYLAFLAGRRGDLETELRLYDEIVRISSGSHDATAVALRRVASGYGLLRRGDPAGAIKVFSEAAAVDAASSSWWERVRAAHAEVGIGAAELALGRPRDAARHLNVAVAIYRDAAELNEENETRFRLDDATQLFAEAVAGRGSPERRGENHH